MDSSVRKVKLSKWNITIQNTWFHFIVSKVKLAMRGKLIKRRPFEHYVLGRQKYNRRTDKKIETFSRQE